MWWKAGYSDHVTYIRITEKHLSDMGDVIIGFKCKQPSKSNHKFVTKYSPVFLHLHFLLIEKICGLFCHYVWISR